MSYLLNSESSSEPKVEEETRKKVHSMWFHVFLFFATFVTTFLAGAMWYNVGDFSIKTWSNALAYSVLMLTFISAHEFGHYFAAKYHGLDVTLPYYIPFPPFLINAFGTMGAVIRTKSPVKTKKVLFDVGVAGPLAGFVVCLIILIIGFITLPGKEYLLEIHPEFEKSFNGEIPTFGLTFGDTALFSFLRNWFSSKHEFIPPMNEIYHYPFLCVGWFGMLVTSLNMLPFGQLDGGHILYAMFGKKQKSIAYAVSVVLIIIAFGGIFALIEPTLYIDSPDTLFTFLQAVFKPFFAVVNLYAPWYLQGWTGWILWIAFARFFVGFEHPHVFDSEPLGAKRMAIGWISILVFVLTFSFNGIFEQGVQQKDLEQKSKSTAFNNHTQHF